MRPTLFVPLVLFLAAPAALAQCEKDADCKGERICENGQCIYPSESQRGLTPPPPPAEGGELKPSPEATGTAKPAAPQAGATQLPSFLTTPIDAVAPEERDAWWAEHGKKLAVGINLPPMIIAPLALAVFPLNVELQYAVSRRIVAYVAPELDAYFGRASGFGFSARLGARYFFTGSPQGGLWVGGDLSPGVASLSLFGISQTVLGFSLNAEGGYVFRITDNITVNAALGLSLAPLVPTGGLAIRVAPAYHF